MVFTVKLDDQTSAPAASAADAVRGLSQEFEALQKELSAVEAMQRSALAFHDKSAFKAPSEGDIMADIRKQQQAALAGHDQSRDAALGLAKQQEAAAASAAKEAAAAAETSKWFQDLTASGNSAAEQVDVLRGKFEALLPAITVAVAVITAVAAALWKLGAMAIGATQAKDALREMLGADTLDMVEELSEKLPYTADALGAWASKLKVAGYEGDKLKTAIEAVAASAARMKDGGAAAQGLLERLKLMEDAGAKIALDRRLLTQLAAAGLGMQDLATAMGVPVEKLKTMQLTAEQVGTAVQKALITKGAGALTMLGQTWDSIQEKVLEGIGDAFDGLSDLVGPFMSEVQALASEFFKGSVASKGFAGVMKSLLTPAFQFATQAVHFLHLGFLQLEVYVLRARLALRPITSALDKVGVSSGLVSVGMYLLKGTVITLAVVFGVLALAVALVALPFVVFGLAVYGIVSAVEYLIDVIGGAIDHFDNLSSWAAEAGSNLITSLGNAIMSGADWVVGLVRNLASSIIGAITSTLQIHSPSRVMARIGGHITAGLAEGVEQGTPQVTAAAYGAGSAAAGGATAGGEGGGRGGNTYNVAITVQGGGRDWQSISEEAFAAFMERLALRAGA